MNKITNPGRDQDRFRGCLIGGAAGDALGYAVEFLRLSQIEAKYGESGITAYDLTGGVAEISDDTQMTLFTATGLLLGTTRGATRGIQSAPETYVARSYKDWLKTQDYESTSPDDDYRYSWLLDVPELHHRRAPGNTCITALRNKKPVEGSKGCGGIMRVAPVGLYFDGENYRKSREDIAKIGDAVAAITHGHDLGRIPAAALVYIINSILYYNNYSGKDGLRHIVLDSIVAMENLYVDSPFINVFSDLIRKAVDLSAGGKPDKDCICELGEGWVAEETLAIAVYCALRHSGDFERALIAAVNHDGDSDSTGSVTGNILGAWLGMGAIPAKFVDDLELKDVILEVADDLCHDCTVDGYGHIDADGEIWCRKYIENGRVEL